MFTAYYCAVFLWKVLFNKAVGQILFGFVAIAASVEIFVFAVWCIATWLT